MSPCVSFISSSDTFFRPTSGPSITLLTAAELSESKDNVDIHANPFNLRPDPAEFVAFLKSLDRQDVSSEIFVKLLNEYRALKENDADPMQYVHPPKSTQIIGTHVT